MELTGRTYIFFAATLILLAGSVRLYSEVSAASPRQVNTVGAKMASCDARAVELANRRLGCAQDGDVRVRAMGGGSSLTMLGQ